MALTAEQRSLRARIGGLARSSLYDGREVTAAGRAAFLRRFEDQVDPDRTLPHAERLRRAEAARRKYFTQLALASSKARAKAKEARS